MNNYFDEIFNKAQEVWSANKVIQKNNDKGKVEESKIKQSEKENKIKNNYMNANPEKNAWSKELYKLIKEYKFNIQSYEKIANEDANFYEDPDQLLEIYYCTYKNWSFEVKNYSDVDIGEGIFSLTNVYNLITNEPIEFYADLGCRNTSEPRRDEFLEMIEYDTYQEFMDNRYKKYYRLPQLLRDNGLSVEEVNYGFEINNPSGYLKINDKVFVVVYRAWYDEIKTVVTTKKKWDVNSSIEYDGQAYYFDYKSESEIDEFVKCINAFIDDISGKIGFYEDDRYYSNDDISCYYRSIKDKNEKYHEHWNTYLIQLKEKQSEDCRGYNDTDSTIVNKYKGLEIYSQAILTFNEAAQWTIGKYANKSIITFSYDKRKDVENCILNIDNYIYKDREYEIYNDETEEYELDTNKLVKSITLKGKFSELMDYLKLYINKMCEIHEIEL